MKNLNIWLTAIFIMLAQYSNSQKNEYIATDTTMTLGVQLINGTARNNAQFIQLKDSEIQYSPDQLTEYRFKNGNVYKSKNISVSGQTKKVFLETLEQGKITLYYYTEKGLKTYFLEKDSTVFVELPKGDDFRARIIEFTNDFEWNFNQTQLVYFNRKSLSKLISLYNNGINQPIPYPRFGINASFTRMSLSVPSTISNQLRGISFTPRSTASFGIFADLPMDMSNFSFNTGVNFSKSGFYAHSRTLYSDIDVLVYITSANLPVLLRYTLPTLDWRPFINAGGIYSYHLKSDSKKYESVFDQNIIIINEILSESFISDGMFGYSLGIGLQHKLNYKKIASIELRYNHFNGNGKTFDKSQLEFFIGFSL